MSTGTAQENVTVVKQIEALFNEHELEAATKYLHPDYVETNVATGETFRGPEGFKASARAWIAPFPDARVEIVNYVAIEDQVVIESIGRGTHTGTIQTSHGTSAATGKSFTVKLCEVFVFKDRKVAELRLYFDRQSLLDQLGLQH
jgi:steroid delta-isomerase-like uncharacterized protein